MAMNLSRKIAELMISSPSMEKHLLRPLIVLQHSFYSTTKPKTTRKQQQQKPEPADSKVVVIESTLEPHGIADDAPRDDRHVRLYDAPKLPQMDAKKSRVWPRPSEIPWQAKVVNSVNLIGLVAMPIQFESSPDGKYWAGTILAQEKTPNFSPIWIPLIFEGELAHVAACHLKEKDLVHVAGHLMVDPPQFRVEQGNSSIQVMVGSLSFVQESHRWKESPKSHKQDEQTTNFSDNELMHPSVAEVDGIATEHLWNDLLASPHEWWDCRLHKSDPADADFKHKYGKQLLWINMSTPQWIFSKLDKLTFHHKADQEGQESAKASINGSSMDSLWRELVGNPNKWWDNRKAKVEGLISPKYPDFKHKDSRQGLWISTAPEWALPKLEVLEFDNTFKTSQAKESKDKKESEEQSWKDLVDNPTKWWDNRSSKRNARGPDFKHKETGKGLWLDSSPVWVQDQLPPVKSMNIAVWGKDALS